MKEPSNEERIRLAERISKVMSEILSDKYGLKITVTFKAKLIEEAGDKNDTQESWELHHSQCRLAHTSLYDFWIRRIWIPYLVFAIKRARINLILAYIFMYYFVSSLSSSLIIRSSSSDGL